MTKAVIASSQARDQPLSLQKLLAHDSTVKSLHHIDSQKGNLKILQYVKGSSGLSLNSQSSKKRSPSAFSKGLNLSAYQKKMITPADIFKDQNEAVKNQKQSEKQLRHVTQVLKLAE